MIGTLPILEDDIVRLEPFEMKDGIEYVLDLAMACKYTRLWKGQAREILLKFSTLCWYGYDKRYGLRIGVVYLMNINNQWSLHAYKDDNLTKSLDNTMDDSYRAGKLASDYAFTFTNTLLTSHPFENRAATILCKKLGFKEDFITLKMEKK